MILPVYCIIFASISVFQCVRVCTCVCINLRVCLSLRLVVTVQCIYFLHIFEYMHAVLYKPVCVSVPSYLILYYIAATFASLSYYRVQLCQLFFWKSLRVFARVRGRWIERERSAVSCLSTSKVCVFVKMHITIHLSAMLCLSVQMACLCVCVNESVIFCKFAIWLHHCECL